MESIDLFNEILQSKSINEISDYLKISKNVLKLSLLAKKIRKMMKGKKNA